MQGIRSGNPDRAAATTAQAAACMNEQGNAKPLCACRVESRPVNDYKTMSKWVRNLRSKGEPRGILPANEAAEDPWRLGCALLPLSMKQPPAWQSKRWLAKSIMSAFLDVGLGRI